MNERLHANDEFDVDGPETSPTPRMSTHAPELHQYLRARGIDHVRAEYCGADDRGGFIALQCTREDEACCRVSEAHWHLQIKAVFRGLLLARHPNWSRGHGSCGDFRWNLRADSLTHSHYTRGDGNERTTHHGVDRP